MCCYPFPPPQSSAFEILCKLSCRTFFHKSPALVYFSLLQAPASLQFLTSSLPQLFSSLLGIDRHMKRRSNSQLE